MSHNDKSSRTDFIKQIAALPVAAAAIAAVSTAAEAAKSSKGALKYQDVPKDGQQCSACSLYIANKKTPNKSACKVVAGDIKPTGYCIAFQKK